MSSERPPHWIRHKGPWITIFALVNSGYLWAAGAPSRFYIANVLLHLILGGIVILLWIGVSKAILKREQRRTGLTLSAVTVLLMGVGATTGVALIVFGNLRPQRLLLYTHIASSFGACLCVVLWFWRQRFFERRPALLAASVAVLLGALAVPGSRPWWPTPARYVITNPSLPPAEMAEEAMGGATGPFFPSAAATTHEELIPSSFFLESETCGRAGCHPDVVAQWASSAHRFSSFNNQWYRKSIEYMQEVVGLESPRWCAGCHDHALLFSGKMDQPVADFIDTPEAHAGLGCVSCHSVVHVQNTMGNGSFEIEYPEMHDLATSDNALVQMIHDFVVDIDPEPHRQAFLKPFHREQAAEFCSSCHKVHLDAPVNNYRWLRGFNTYDNWQASGVSGQGARSFYAPPEPQDCLTCHMPLEPSTDAGNKGGYIRSHRFLAANTALPVANQDSAHLAQTVAFLQRNQLSVDIFAVSEPAALVGATTDAARPRGDVPFEAATTFAVGEEQGLGVGSGGVTQEAVSVFAPLEDGAAVLQRGASVRLDVVVRTLGLGHFFPSGTVDAQEAWLELKAVDDAGRTLFWSGWVEDDGAGAVDSSAHFYRNLLIDAHGNRINKRNAWASRSVVYVNLIPPGAANVAHYRLDVPTDVGASVTVTARLHYRKFDWWHTQFSYAGRRDPADLDPDVTPHYDDGRWVFDGDTRGVSGQLKEIPVLPVVTMASDSLTLRVAPALDTEALAARRGTAEDRMRWNDYGIGLLLQGDLKGAEQAFLQVTTLDPGYADGWVNLARVYLQEGNLEAGATALEGAERAQPGFHKTHYFRGLWHKAQGDYAEALADLLAVAERYPRDRVVLNQIGRVHYLNASLDEAVRYFLRVLAIDPEDLMAHYNLALSYRALGDAEASEAHEVRYLRFKEDETAPALARQYRQDHPHDNNEALPVHEHQSFWQLP